MKTIWGEKVPPEQTARESALRARVAMRDAAGAEYHARRRWCYRPGDPC